MHLISHLPSRRGVHTDASGATITALALLMTLNGSCFKSWELFDAHFAAIVPSASLDLDHRLAVSSKLLAMATWSRVMGVGSRPR